jgi:hypothetical protein
MPLGKTCVVDSDFVPARVRHFLSEALCRSHSAAQATHTMHAEAGRSGHRPCDPPNHRRSAPGDWANTPEQPAKELRLDHACSIIHGAQRSRPVPLLDAIERRPPGEPRHSQSPLARPRAIGHDMFPGFHVCMLRRRWTPAKPPVTRTNEVTGALEARPAERIGLTVVIIAGDATAHALPPDEAGPDRRRGGRQSAQQAGRALLLVDRTVVAVGNDRPLASRPKRLLRNDAAARARATSPVDDRRPTQSRFGEVSGSLISHLAL